MDHVEIHRLRKDCIQELIATPSMKAHLSQKWSRLQEILETWPELGEDHG